MKKLFIALALTAVSSVGFASNLPTEAKIRAKASTVYTINDVTYTVVETALACSVTVRTGGVTATFTANTCGEALAAASLFLKIAGIK